MKPTCIARSRISPGRGSREDERDGRTAGDDDRGDSGAQPEHDARVRDDQQEFCFMEHVQAEVGQVAQGLSQRRQVGRVVHREVDYQGGHNGR